MIQNIVVCTVCCYKGPLYSTDDLFNSSKYTFDFNHFQNGRTSSGLNLNSVHIVLSYSYYYVR